ncbi:MAG TPA: homoserine kinase [Gemmatimonadaceae bacterium]
MRVTAHSPVPAPSTTVTRVRAIAPGGVGNIGPGLDILGLAVTGLHDEVIAERHDGRGVVVLDAGHPDIPADPGRHSSAIAAAAVARRAGVPDAAIAIRLVKGLPLSGGQGGSAASSVAGAVAADALLGAGLDTNSLLECALEAESANSGRHADNIAPILLGGICLVRSMDPLDVIPLPVPATLRVVLALPAQRLRTSEARAVLPATLPRALALHQAAQVAAMVAAFASGDLELLRRSVDDRIAEPARATLIPGFAAAKAAALEAGALGCSISGAGPTAFAFAAGDDEAFLVAEAMRAGYASAGVEATTRVAEIDTRGTVAAVLT